MDEVADGLCHRPPTDDRIGSRAVRPFDDAVGREDEGAGADEPGDGARADGHAGANAVRGHEEIADFEPPGAFLEEGETIMRRMTDQRSSFNNQRSLQDRTEIDPTFAGRSTEFGIAQQSTHIGAP